MKVADRKQIVARLLSRAKEETSREVEVIKSQASPTREFIYEHMKQYVLSKYLLAPECQETDIKELAKLSLARTMKIDPRVIRELDQATPCDHATSESAKKVLLLYAVQKDLELKPNPEKLSNVENLDQLATYVYEALQENV